MLGVALGVVLMPQLAGARASNDPERYSAMLDWGLRLVRPAGRALVDRAAGVRAAPGRHALPLWRVQGFRRGAGVAALAGYGVGLLGLVAIKVLAPGFYANRDMRTPVRIAIMVLVITQLLNIALVPIFKHRGLALSIGIGALINAGALLVGLIRRGSYRPSRAGACSRCRCWPRARCSRCS